MGRKSLPDSVPRLLNKRQAAYQQWAEDELSKQDAVGWTVRVDRGSFQSWNVYVSAPNARSGISRDIESVTLESELREVVRGLVGDLRLL